MSAVSVPAPAPRRRQQQKALFTSLAVLVLVAIVFGAAFVRAVQSADSLVGSGFWHTSGVSILDENNQHVRIAGVTWYGMESSFWVPAGLDYQPYTTIMDEVKSLGYNAIRLPYSNELVETNPIVTQHIVKNPRLYGMHALSVLDLIANYARKIGIKLILDDHVSAAERPTTVNDLTEALWFNRRYPESAWIHDWVSLARRYKNNDAVIGFDLRNEPHTNGPGPWSLHAYLTQGATWGASASTANVVTDWRLAAERAGNAVLSINPHVLIFVEGLQLYPDTTQPFGAASYWWGSILRPVKLFPVLLNVPHQLVYSPHDWGPRKYRMPWFNHMTYASMLRIWHQEWSFLLDNPNAAYAAPVWIGEFGTCTELPTCVDKQLPGNQATWFHALLRFLHEHPQVGWSFYALDGTNANRNPTDNGILNPKWNGVASDALQKDLASVQGQ